MEPIGVVHYGLGAIGRAAAVLVARRPSLCPLAGVDANPELWGRDLGELVGARRIDVAIRPPSADPLPSGVRVALHSTSSSLRTVAPQLRGLIERGLSVVSTCEELSYPSFEEPELAEELDAAARRAGVAVLGAGVNPGFAMDYLPLVLTAATDGVRAIEIHRIQDASRRRPQLQRKVGAGLTPAEFEAARDRGPIGHVGLRQSARAVAAALGWTLDRLDESVRPLLANVPTPLNGRMLEPGTVLGIDHTVVGVSDGRERVRLRLEMALGRADARDVVRIDATPPLELVIPGGVHGDDATVALVVNAIPRLLDARSGLRTMIDLPPPHASRALGVL